MPTEVVLVKDGKLSNELNRTLETFIHTHPNLIKVLELPINQGLGKALNAGLELCSNEIIVRMDSDDICYPNRFEQLVRYIVENPQLSAVGTSIQEFNKMPGDLRRFRSLPLKYPQLLKFAKYRTPLNHPSVAFRKSHILEVGSYQDMPLFEDYYLWARIIMKGHLIENLEEPLLHFRIGNDMIGRRHGLSYFKKEYAFLKASKDIKFINNKEFFLSLIMKFPLRLLPKNQLEWVYRKILR